MVNSVEKQIQQLLEKGGEFNVQLDLEELKASLVAADVSCFRADCSRARNRSAVFRAVVKAVDYPEFFGSSFDGFYDCLTDTLMDSKAGVALLFDDLHSADPDLERDMPRLMDVLEEVAEYAREQGKIFAYGIKHGGRHPDAEPGEVRNWSDTAE